MALPEIQRVTYRHEAILNWLVCNPHRTLKECAGELGFSQAWLSCIIHSDAFQMLYQARMAELGEGVVHTIKDRLTGVAALALEKTAEKLENGSCSEDFLRDTTKNVLQAIGFAPQKGGNSAQVVVKQEFHLDEQRLLEARARARARFETPGQAPLTSTRQVADGSAPALPGPTPGTINISPVQAESVPEAAHQPEKVSFHLSGLTLNELLGGLAGA